MVMKIKKNNKIRIVGKGTVRITVPFLITKEVLAKFGTPSEVIRFVREATNSAIQREMQNPASEE